MRTIQRLLICIPHPHCGRGGTLRQKRPQELGHLQREQRSLHQDSGQLAGRRQDTRQLTGRRPPTLKKLQAFLGQQATCLCKLLDLLQ